jgi:hypothetical protein
MKQLKIPFEFIDDFKKIRLYKAENWILVNSKEHDPIASRNTKTTHIFVINLDNGEIHDSLSVQANVLASDIRKAKRLTIKDYIELGNALKFKGLALNKKKIEICVNFPI